MSGDVIAPAQGQDARQDARSKAILATQRRTGGSTTGRRIGRTILLGVVLTVVALAGTFLLDPYRNFQLAQIAATFCAAAGLTVLIGHSGQLSLGHAALMASGGYAYALTANALNAAGIDGAGRFLVSLAAALLVSGALGWMLGLAAARLRGPYLAGVTLALVIAVPAIAAVFSGVLRGDQGLRAPFDPVPAVLARLIAVEQWQAWVAIVVTGGVVTALVIASRGRLGLRMRAVRDDEVAARLNGVRAGRTKITAFTLSAVAAGAGGAVLCFVTQSVAPGAYTLAFSLLLVVAVVLGGLGSIGGAAVGSALIILLPWIIGALTDLLPLPTDVEQRLSGNLPLLVFGLLLIVVMIARPGGFAGLITHLSRPGARAAAREASSSSAAAPAFADAPTSADAPSHTEARPHRKR